MRRPQPFHAENGAISFLPDSFKRLRQIGDDILNILQPDRQADHARVDARGDQLLIGELPVRLRCRMQHTGADIRNMHHVLGELQRIHPVHRGLAPALDDERDHAAAAVRQIGLCALMIGVALQPRIAD